MSHELVHVHEIRIASTQDAANISRIISAVREIKKKSII